MGRSYGITEMLSEAFLVGLEKEGIPKRRSDYQEKPPKCVHQIWWCTDGTSRMLLLAGLRSTVGCKRKVCRSENIAEKADRQTI